MKKYFILFSILLTSILVACTQQSEETKNDRQDIIKYGKGAGPYTELFEAGILPILEKQGYKFEVVEFSDLTQNDTALAEGEIDVNVEQHTAYMNNFNKNNSSDLVALSPIPTVPTALFSKTHKDLNGIKKAAKIAIPSDPSNTSRALALLEKAGWITLSPSANRQSLTVDDIKENPYELDIHELESAQIPPSLDDFDYAVIVGAIVHSAKIDPSISLLQEDIADHLWLQVVVREENKDKEWAKAIVEAYKSDEFAKYIEKNNDGLWQLPKYSN